MRMDLCSPILGSALMYYMDGGCVWPNNSIREWITATCRMTIFHDGLSSPPNEQLTAHIISRFVAFAYGTWTLNTFRAQKFHPQKWLVSERKLFLQFFSSRNSLKFPNEIFLELNSVIFVCFVYSGRWLSFAYVQSISGAMARNCAEFRFTFAWNMTVCLGRKCAFVLFFGGFCYLFFFRCERESVNWVKEIRWLH